MILREIKGYSGYKISNTGVIYNKKGIELKGWLWRHHKRLRRRVTLIFYENNIRYRKVASVSRLVAITFIPNPDNKPEVNHIDGDTTNDDYRNLEWVTRKENINHAIKNNLISYKNNVILKHSIIGNEVFFNTISEAARFLGLKRTCNIYKAIQNKNHTVKGYYIIKI